MQKRWHLLSNDAVTATSLVGVPTREQPTWPAASLGLIAGFGVAVITDLRWLGGIVLIAAATWCGLRWLRLVGRARTALLVLVFTAAFVVSHPLGHAIGSWPAVLTVASIVGVATWLLADRARPAAG